MKNLNRPHCWDLGKMGDLITREFDSVASEGFRIIRTKSLWWDVVPRNRDSFSQNGGLWAKGAAHSQFWLVLLQTSLGNSRMGIKLESVLDARQVEWSGRPATYQSKQGGGDSIKFSHMGLESILWKSSVKINFFLALRFPFLSGRAIFCLDGQLTTFVFFASIGNEHLSHSSHQHRGVQLSAVLSVTSGRSISYLCLSGVIFPKPEGFVWEYQIPWKYCIIIYMINLSVCRGSAVSSGA